MRISELINDFEIFILTYNRIDYLKKSLSSAVNQSIKGLKITVLDNGSSDETEDYIKEIQTQNDNIIYIKEPINIGPFNIFLKAVSLASKKYVMIFHDDDILHPQYIEAALKIIERHSNIDLIYTKINSFVDETNINLGTFDSVSYKIYEKQDFIKHIYINKGSSHLVFPCVIYKTKNLKAMVITETIESAGTIADMDMVVETLINGYGVFIENKMYNYRDHNHQESHVKKLYSSEIIANNLYFKEKLKHIFLGKLYFNIFSYYWFKNMYYYFGCYEDISLSELLKKGYEKQAVTKYTYLMSKFWGKFLIPFNHILKKFLQIERFKKQKIFLGGIDQ